jgi:thioredoxin-related protein
MLPLSYTFTQGFRYSYFRQLLKITLTEPLFFLDLLWFGIQNYMKLKKYLSLGLIVAISAASAPAVFAQAQEAVAAGTATKDAVKWLTWEEAVEKNKTEKRKIFVDVFTDWCGWCKVMDRNTFTEASVAKLLNEEFYAVKFNAEQTADVVFNNVTFKFIAMGGGKGVHQLAAALLNNQMSYPNFVFLDEEFKIIPVFPGYQSLPGYRKPEEFHIFLDFVGNDIYKKMKIDDFQKTEYKSPYAAPKQDGGQ